ncbi:hypothetical protein SynBIOSE41_02859 [Synechococcus sp. BIOS-E4-1]|nr:hypothetical protein [Synechococcus sp. BIOS-E4-1]QNI55347.1 hypothetical protein SynBIOSE41_02859 [Synechococcus sp. BIOS-E4-1]
MVETPAAIGYNSSTNQQLSIFGMHASVETRGFLRHCHSVWPI